MKQPFLFKHSHHTGTELDYVWYAARSFRTGGRTSFYKDFS